jgi:hypothetical protein
MRIPTVLFAAGLVVLFACTDTAPTDIDQAALAPQTTLLKHGATGAVPGLPADLDLTAIDEDGNADGIVCVKTVPAGKGKAPPRTIAKDNKDGVCPGGFEEHALDLPACTFLQPVAECDCDAADGFTTVVDGTEVCITPGGPAG